VRKWRRFSHRPGAAATANAPRSEDKLPPAWLNSLLQGIFVGLAKVRVPFPFGVSLLLVARRRG
jgi:hypothetical protein